MRTLNEGDFKNKKTLVRVDFNVALGPKGEVADDFRIAKTLPTIKFLAESGAIVVLMSHLETEDGPASLRPVSRCLAEMLDRPVKFLRDCVGEKTREAISGASAGEIILLENLRFHEGEKRNDAEFAAELAKNGDCYVNEAFSCCHRAHASIAGVPRLLPSYGGMLLSEEIGSLRKIVKNPARPLVAIIGGVKMDTKAKVIAAIAAIADLCRPHALQPNTPYIRCHAHIKQRRNHGAHLTCLPISGAFTAQDDVVRTNVAACNMLYGAG